MDRDELLKTLKRRLDINIEQQAKLRRQLRANPDLKTAARIDNLRMHEGALRWQIRRVKRSRDV